MTLLLANAASTLFMVGLIWFVQVVHYPLAGAVGADAFVAYQRAHMARTSWVVGLPMLVELLTTILLIWTPPAGVSAWMPWVGGALLAAVWMSTAVFQVPTHEILLGGLEAEKVRFLVQTNWIRTVGWSLRGGICVWMLWEVFSAAAKK